MNFNLRTLFGKTISANKVETMFQTGDFFPGIIVGLMLISQSRICIATSNALLDTPLPKYPAFAISTPTQSQMIGIWIMHA